MTVLVVCLDLLREAVARKWFLGLFILTTIGFAIIGLALRLDVVDGALAATHFFGEIMDSKIQSVDVALRPVFEAGMYMVFYGVIVTGVFGCSGFGPSMLAPGRIEHLLALPIRRFELLLGTYLGVLVVASIGAMYGTVGLVLILGVKTGYWNFQMIFSGLYAIVSFAPVYAAMLGAALFVRSAPFCGLVGVVLVIAGITAGFKDELVALWEPGVARTVFEIVMAPLPRISTLAQVAGNTASSQSVQSGEVVRLMASCGVFAASMLAFGVWRFEKKDF